MNTTETILELDKILDMLAERAVSDLAAEFCKMLTPAADSDTIRKMRAETDDAVSVCLRKGTPPFSNLTDLSDILSYADKGGVLTPGQLILVLGALSSAKRVRAFLTADQETPKNSVTKPAAALVPVPGLEQHISKAIISDTEIADNASPALYKIRRTIDQQNDRIRKSLARYITGKTFEDILMDKVITMRNGRFVLPVKQEQQHRFPGIVHDRSKGGATVFIEPQNVVDMNNKLRELELEERTEIDRILSELSAEVAVSAELMRENQEILIKLDFIFAKANLSLDMKACPAEQSENGVIDIAEGRNPLIDPEKVVPISISFGGTDRLLIITGPNTGGKTVTLKTTGLFILMAQTGLHVPASRASLPVVPRIFADIGDEQSIEQSLSTFSSHMRRIVEIMSFAEADSIVLLDELGAGTDPTEGAALAIAILETLRGRGCIVMATTHYTELKKYAIATDGVGNASMEFDLATLSPTFRLNMGNPGRSNAFEISSKLGLGREIVERARELLDGETIYFDDVMEQIELDRGEAAKHLMETEKAQEEAKAVLMDIENKQKKAEKERAAIISKAREEAERIISDAVEEADAVSEELKALIKDVRTRGVADGTRGAEAIQKPLRGEDRGDENSEPIESPVDAGDVLRKAGESKKRLKKKLDGSLQDAAQKKNLDPGTVPSLAPGDIVALPGTDNTGEVLTAPDDRGRVIVRSGAVKLTLSANELEKQEQPSRKPGQQGHRYAKIVMSKMGRVKQSIDLHGKNLDEAELMVDKYLDDAILARMHEIVINHGRGSGILRDGIRRMLKKNKHVKSFRDGNFDEGGDGVTIVTLSDK